MRGVAQEVRGEGLKVIVQEVTSQYRDHGQIVPCRGFISGTCRFMQVQSQVHVDSCRYSHRYM